MNKRVKEITDLVCMWIMAIVLLFLSGYLAYIGSYYSLLHQSISSAFLTIGLALSMSFCSFMAAVVAYENCVLFGMKPHKE